MSWGCSCGQMAFYFHSDPSVVRKRHHIDVRRCSWCFYALLLLSVIFSAAFTVLSDLNWTNACDCRAAALLIFQRSRRQLVLSVWQPRWHDGPFTSSLLSKVSNRQAFCRSRDNITMFPAGQSDHAGSGTSGVGLSLLDWPLTGGCKHLIERTDDCQKTW